MAVNLRRVHRLLAPQAVEIKAVLRHAVLRERQARRTHMREILACAVIVDREAQDEALDGRADLGDVDARTDAARRIHFDAVIVRARVAEEDQILVAMNAPARIEAEHVGVDLDARLAPLVLVAEGELLASCEPQPLAAHELRKRRFGTSRASFRRTRTRLARDEYAPLLARRAHGESAVDDRSGAHRGKRQKEAARPRRQDLGRNACIRDLRRHAHLRLRRCGDGEAVLALGRERAEVNELRQRRQRAARRAHCTFAPRLFPFHRIRLLRRISADSRTRLELPFRAAPGNCRKENPKNGRRKASRFFPVLCQTFTPYARQRASKPP